MKGFTVLTTVSAAERNVSRLCSTFYNVLWLIDCDSSVSLFSQRFQTWIPRSAQSNLLKRRIASDNGCNVVMIVIRIDRNRHIIFRRVTSNNLIDLPSHDCYRSIGVFLYHFLGKIHRIQRCPPVFECEARVNIS